MMNLYLDYNATTPIHPEVLEEMISVYTDHPGNPDSRTHLYGNTAREIVEKARSQTAQLLGIVPSELIFTSGATEGNNMVFLGLKKYGLDNGKNHIIVSSIEHKAVLEVCRHLQEEGFQVDFVDPEKDGSVSVERILDLITERTLIVSLMHVNNETGVIQPVDVLGKELRKRQVLFHTDATQSVGKLVEEIRNLDYDFLTFSAHKFEGPQGIGGLVIRNHGVKSSPLCPVFFGGGQESGIRPGTVPTALAAGCGVASKIMENEYLQRLENMRKFQSDLIHLLQDSGLPYSIHGNIEKTIPNTLNFSIHGVNSEALMIMTQELCSVSNGSACNSKNYSSSYVLRAMGLSENEAEEAIRISWGFQPNLSKYQESLSVFKSFLRTASQFI